MSVIGYMFSVKWTSVEQLKHAIITEWGKLLQCYRPRKILSSVITKWHRRLECAIRDTLNTDIRQRYSIGIQWLHRKSETSMQQKFITVCRYSLTVLQCIGAVIFDCVDFTTIWWSLLLVCVRFMTSRQTLTSVTDSFFTRYVVLCVIMSYIAGWTTVSCWTRSAICHWLGGDVTFITLSQTTFYME